MAISELTAVVAHVRCFRAGRRVASASGFFYEHARRLYLVTNRHVVVDEEDDHYPDELRLRLHTTQGDLRCNADHSIALHDQEGRPIWLQHPSQGETIDIVAIPLDEDQITSRFFVKALRPANHVPQDVTVPIGQDVLVIGYPLGFHDTVHNLPIVRNALMASVYPVPFEGRPLVLIDARLHRGTSGSPVLTKATNVILRTDGGGSITDRFVHFLIGVHSATLDLPGRDPKRDEPLGLNAVWFASLIPEIIAQSGS